MRSFFNYSWVPDFLIESAKDAPRIYFGSEIALTMPVDLASPRLADGGFKAWMNEQLLLHYSASLVPQVSKLICWFVRYCRSEGICKLLTCKRR